MEFAPEGTRLMLYALDPIVPVNTPERFYAEERWPHHGPNLAVERAKRVAVRRLKTDLRL